MTEEINSNEETMTDPLLDCLVILTHIYHNPFSREALRAGLPLKDNRLTPEVFMRAAERAGLSTRILKRSLAHLSNLVLPAVVILKEGKACVLQSINSDETVDVILPESAGGVVKKTIKELEEVYTGLIIFVNPVIKFEERSDIKVKEISQKSWFWGTLWQYRAIYVQVILGALFINVVSLLGPLFAMNVYDRVIPNYAITTLWVLLIGLITVYVFDFILRTLRSYMIDLCGKKADIVLASVIFQHVLGIQLANKPTSVGAFVNNLREFEVLRDFFTSSTLTTLIDLPFVILYFVLINYIGGNLIWVPLIIVPIVFIFSLILERPMRKAVMQTLKGAAQKHAILVESVTGLETIKCLSFEGKMQYRWEQFVSNTAKHGLQARLYSSLVINIANFSQQLIYILMIALGVYEIHKGNLTLGGLIACSILASRIIAPLSQLASILTRLQQARMSLECLNNIMKMPQERPLEKKYLYRPTLQGNIEFENVTFSYPDQEIKALDNVSFKFKHLERIAILGQIGSGKSTIQKLLLGLYQPNSGSIRIDGIDLNQIDPVDLRRNIGYVPQESLLFFGTVRDNITMTAPWVSDRMIAQAAYLSGADSFINRHPLGYALPIGERGEGISGGQRQSIAIARALLSNPSIWLFDEPTSAMDIRTEQELIQRIANYLRKKTLLLVTHRQSLLALVDRVIIMEQGRLIKDGSKESILKSNPGS
ncbi:MAG: type I secretion system permease/ATPase [Proteobacteria bacterium]|nr:type I secretion system permease/ATPase [Pseudomonadota bacterium]